MGEFASYDLKKLKNDGVMKQKSVDLFSVRLKVLGGHVTSEQLRALADAAERHGVGHVHLTTRQGIEIPCVEGTELDNLQQTLGQGNLQFGACGARVRTITACQGSLCTYGLIDPQAVAQAVDERVTGVEGLPHKFKIGITGCPNGCIKPQENDLGVMGQRFISRNAEACMECGVCAESCRPGALRMEDGEFVEETELCRNCGRCIDACPVEAIEDVGTGYAVFVGGKMGNQPRMADRLPFEVTSVEGLLDVISATLQWYSDHGKTKERFGATIDRVGLDGLVSKLREAAGGSVYAG